MKQNIIKILPDGTIEILYSPENIDLVLQSIKKFKEIDKHHSISSTPIVTAIKTQGKSKGITDQEKQDYKKRLPKLIDVVKYIESKGGNCKHTIYDVQEHFFNRRFYAKSNKVERSQLEKNEHDVYVRIYEKLKRARIKITEKTGREWKDTWKYSPGKPKYKEWWLG